ncbi:MAG: DUF6782 family putative metallopeptidase [Alphaproteobacteria bacterium]
MAQADKIAQNFTVAASWETLDAEAYPLLEARGKLVRPSIDLDLGDTPAAHENLKLIETALLILSQSDTGRKLLQAAKDADYLIVANPETVGGAGKEHEEEAQASADVESRLINLRCNGTPLMLAMRLAHELAHVTQFDAGLTLSICGPHPVSALRQLLAQEADARAYEMRVAIELAAPRPGEPANRLTFPDALDAAAESVGNSYGRSIVDKIRPKVFDGTVKVEGAMLATFAAFYSSPSLRAHYEATILHGLSKKDPAVLQDPENFQQWRDADDIIKRLDSRGAYLCTAPPRYIDLDGREMMSASQETVDKLKALEKIRHQNPATMADKPWDITPYTLQRVAAPANSTAPKPR